MSDRTTWKGSKEEEHLLEVERSLSELLKMCQKEIARMSLERLTLERQLKVQRELLKSEQQESFSTNKALAKGSSDVYDPEVDFNLDFTTETLSFEDSLNVD